MELANDLSIGLVETAPSTTLEKGICFLPYFNHKCYYDRIGSHCAQEFKTRAHVSEIADPLWGIKELPLNQKERLGVVFTFDTVAMN